MTMVLPIDDQTYSKNSFHANSTSEYYSWVNFNTYAWKSLSSIPFNLLPNTNNYELEWKKKHATTADKYLIRIH